MKRFTLILCSIIFLTGLATGVSAQKDDKKPKPTAPVVTPGKPKPPKDDKPKKPAMAGGELTLYLKEQ